ncbi:MAG: GAF domain-containing protein [Janthinobacterium lividum]
MTPSATESLIAAHADRDQPGATFRALDAALAERPGHKLFTILVHHPAARQSERFYSNRPTEYPVGGRKPVTDSGWMQQVVHGGQPWIGGDAEAVRWAFYDWELILSLGCESCLNLPVRWRGETLGTLNLLHGAGHYTEADLPYVALLAHLALPALMLISRA